MSDESPGRRIGRALDALSAGDPAIADPARALVSALLQAHGEGLTRLLEIVHDAAEDPAPIFTAILTDPLVEDLLLLHDLHPVEPRVRAERALASARDQVGSIAADAVIEFVDDTTVGLRVGAGVERAEVRTTLSRAVANAVPTLQVTVLDAPASRRSLPVLR